MFDTKFLSNNEILNSDSFLKYSRLICQVKVKTMKKLLNYFQRIWLVLLYDWLLNSPIIELDYKYLYLILNLCIGFILQFVDLGVVTSIEYNHKPVESARKGQEVCVKIEPIPGEAPKMFGRHFDEKDFVVSKVSFSCFLIYRSNIFIWVNQRCWINDLHKISSRIL